MKQKQNAGFSLIEVVIAIAILGIVVVPACDVMVRSIQLNGKAESMLQAQLAVSSAVETLMAEGIEKESADYGSDVVPDPFTQVIVKTVQAKDAGNNLLPYYNVTVSDNNKLVEVETTIHAKEGG